MSEPTTENLRDVIASAIETTEAPPAAAPAALEPVAAEEPHLESSGADAETPAEGANADLNALAERPRDEKGKFAKAEKTPEAPAEQAQEITPGPKSGPKGDKAPVSWRPEVREHWGKLPPEVRAEVARREQEVQRTLQENAEARRNVEALARTIAPYEAYIRAENASPLQAIDNLMATAVKLRTGTAQELATMMAGLVQQFGTGRFGNQFVEMLDSALAGAAPRVDPQQQALQQAVQQQLAPVQQFMTQFQQAQAMQQQQLVTQASTEVESFIGRAEFGEDVRDEMADLMEVAAKRGRELSLQDAYRQACLANPRVRAVLEQRAKAKTAQQGNTAAQRARAAAVSVSGAPSLGSPHQAPPSDVRSAIEQAIALSSR